MLSCVVSGWAQRSAASVWQTTSEQCFEHSPQIFRLLDVLGNVPALAGCQTVPVLFSALPSCTLLDRAPSSRTCAGKQSLRLRIASDGAAAADESRWRRVSVASFGLKGPIPLWLPVPVVQPASADLSSSDNSSRHFSGVQMFDDELARSLPAALQAASQRSAASDALADALREARILDGVEFVVEAPRQGDHAGRVRPHSVLVDDGKVRVLWSLVWITARTWTVRLGLDLANFWRHFSRSRLLDTLRLDESCPFCADSWREE